MFVSLQSEINRGTAQFRRPKFGDDLPSEPACRFLFLCTYCSDAILNFLSRLLYSNYHLNGSDADEFVPHLLHLHKDGLIFHSFLGRGGLTILNGVPQDSVQLEQCQSGCVCFGGMPHSFVNRKISNIDIIFQVSVVHAFVRVFLCPLAIYLRNYFFAFRKIFFTVALWNAHCCKFSFAKINKS